MNLHHLKLFHAVATCKSFTIASEKLHLTQPGISKQIKDLEIFLQTKLFERPGKQMVLTSTGRILYKSCNEIFAVLDSARDEINDLNNLQSGTIHVKAGHTPGIHVLPKIILAFRDKFKKVNITFDISTTSTIYQQVLENKIDLGIVAEKSRDKRLICKPLFEDEMVLLMPKRHPLSKKKSVYPKELMEFQLFVTKKGSATRNMVDSLNKQMDSRLRITEIGSPFAIVKTIETGNGISIMSKLAVENEANQEKVTYRNLRGLSTKRNYYLIYHRNKYIHKALENFIEMFIHISALSPPIWH